MQYQYNLITVILQIYKMGMYWENNAKFVLTVQ